MAKVSGIVCGIQVNDMIVMQSKFDGFDPHSCTKFKAGETIAYKNKTELTPEQAKAFFPSGKVFNLAVCWPLKSPGKKFETPSTPITPSIDNYVLPVPAKTAFTPSEYQESILDTLIETTDHMLIEALAGSGKTSTLVWLVKELHKKGMTKKMKIIYLAFNKSIQEELSEQLYGTGVPAQTTHSFGFTLLKKRFGNNVNISETRTSDTFLKMMCDDNGYNYLEWDVVFILRPDLLPHPLAKPNPDGSWSEEQQQEQNAQYVIATRARHRVYYVENWPFGTNKSLSFNFEKTEEELVHNEAEVEYTQPSTEPFVDNGEPF